MIQSTCSKIPNITISDDFETLINKITYCIQNARESVQMSFSSINLSIFTEHLLQPLKIANKNGAKVMIYTGPNEELNETLKLNSFIGRKLLSEHVSSQSIAVDDTAFISPFIFNDASKNTSTYNQLVTVEKCDAIAKDIKSFTEYYEYWQNNANSKVLPGKYISQSSANRPTTIKLLNSEKEDKKLGSNKNAKESHVFMFHNPQSFLFPMRISTNHVLLSLFDKDPTSIDIYTLSPQCFSSLDDPESNQLTVYMALKSLLMRNKTKIRYLASKHLYSQKKSNCFASFLAFDNSKVHLYEKNYEGLNYIIAHYDDSNDESYIFTQNINDQEFIKMFSLHLATDDENTAKYLKSNFDSIWNDHSTPLTIDLGYLKKK